jgi:alpha,alpha-trehalase
MGRQKTSCTIAAADFDAVIFDLDGVITDTATIHAAAWKEMLDHFLLQRAARLGVPFEPFEPATDYRIHVDGKPRLDGLRSFLQSRDIALPNGAPGDPPALETITGLGRQKKELFLQLIKKEGLKVYGSTIELIDSVRKHGLKTAVISSSKNCAMILDEAGAADLFEVRVDGVSAEQLGIKGKPAPDIFLEAARQLGVSPARTVVVEDAVTGVQAGRAGNFGLVVGIARDGGRTELRQNGADLVVADLAELTVSGKSVAGDPLPSALAEFSKIAGQAAGRRIALFLDYDGTLTPIVDTPEKAVIPDDIREALAALARQCPVGVISGRDLNDVREKVGIDSVVYAGSHGFEIAGSKEFPVSRRVGEEFLPLLDRAAQELVAKLTGIPALLVERKKFAIAVHYRLVDPQRVKEIEGAVDGVVARFPGLRKSAGKKVFELQPEVDWHKGKALLALLDLLELDRDDVLPVYIGDDRTDEDAFRVLKRRGIAIVVRERPYPTAAAYSLRSPAEVGQFLGLLHNLCRRGS